MSKTDFLCIVLSALKSWFDNLRFTVLPPSLIGGFWPSSFMSKRHAAAAATPLWLLAIHFAIFCAHPIHHLFLLQPAAAGVHVAVLAPLHGARLKTGSMVIKFQVLKAYSQLEARNIYVVTCVLWPFKIFLIFIDFFLLFLQNISNQTSC